MAVLNPELQDVLQRTTAIDLLDRLGEVSPASREHCERVGQLSLLVTTEMSEVNELAAGFAGSLHDVGKADSRLKGVVASDRELDDEEIAEVNKFHTEAGAAWIRSLRVDGKDESLRQEAVIAAQYHHTDPGLLITLNGPTVITRIIQIIDKFDAMQDESRVYRRAGAMSAAQAIVTISTQLKSSGAFDDVSRFVVNTLEDQYA
ncbi:MAG TPA: HD domain-containing protein [Candidatus Saccharimonadales bacterium]|nr:HD domain-containing protein [Candidatus Saccharimonadales bacterium]